MWSPPGPGVLEFAVQQEQTWHFVTWRCDITLAEVLLLSQPHQLPATDHGKKASQSTFSLALFLVGRKKNQYSQQGSQLEGKDPS